MQKILPVYDYIQMKARQAAVKTFMVVRPKQSTIENVIRGLDVLEIVKPGTKEAYVDLKPKFNNPRIESELAHYAI